MNKKIFYLLLLTIVGNQLNFPMQLIKQGYEIGKKDTQKINGDWTQVASWEEIKPFVGKIVACKSDSYLYSMGYTLNASSGITYGYIPDIGIVDWSCGEKGYWILRLISTKDYSSNCPLINSYLKEANLGLRLVTSEEIKKIRYAIIMEKAVFEYIKEGSVFELIEGMLKK